MHQKTLEKSSLQKTQRLNAKIAPESPPKGKETLTTSKTPSVWGKKSGLGLQVGDSATPCGGKAVSRGHKPDANQNIPPTQQLRHLGKGTLHCLSAPLLQGQRHGESYRSEVFLCMNVRCFHSERLRPPLAQPRNNDLCLNFLSFSHLFPHFLLRHPDNSSAVTVIPAEQASLSGSHKISTQTVRRILRVQWCMDLFRDLWQPRIVSDDLLPNSLVSIFLLGYPSHATISPGICQVTWPESQYFYKLPWSPHLRTPQKH